MVSAFDSGMPGMWAAVLSFLGLLLVCGAVVHADVTRRRIPDGLCVALCVLAMVHAIAVEGLVAGVLDLAMRAGLALLIGIALTILFLLRQIGGGDVKLTIALLLWVPLVDVPPMLAVAAMAGAMLALALKLLSRIFAFVRSETVPYGVAIVTGGLFVLAPPFAALARASCAAAG